MEKRTGISQSTWSRGFNKDEFWVNVRKELNARADDVQKRVNETEENKERIIQALRIADDRVEASKRRHGNNKEVESEMDTFAGNEASDIGEEVDDEVTAKMTKEELINEIQKISPEVKRKELETKSREDLIKLFRLL